jgi:NAD(P)-dependent dehydrogenase (short-subunit alcohol dehydrogenase family)
MEDLDGRVAVVTGGASGIGLALARQLAAAGMRLVLADVEADPLDAAVADLRTGGTDAVGVLTDVSDADQVHALAEATVAAFGTAHLVCLNAGVAAGGISWEMPESTWRWVVDVNFWGVVHGVRAFVPRLVDQGEGHVLVTASIGGLIGSPGMAPYSATKHAVIGIAESLREDLRLAESPVGVSVLCPGFTRTRMNDSGRSWPERLGPPPADGLAPGHPLLREAFLGRMDDAMEPTDVAAAAVDAIREDRFWVVPDADIGARLRAHLAPVLDPGPDADPVRERPTP